MRQFINIHSYESLLLDKQTCWYWMPEGSNREGSPSSHAENCLNMFSIDGHLANGHKILLPMIGIILKLSDNIWALYNVPGGSDGKASAYNAGDPVSIPGLGRSPGEGNGTLSSLLAWKIPWMEEPGRLQSMGSPRLRFDWATSLHFTSKRCAHAALLHKDTLGPVCWNLFD